MELGELYTIAKNQFDGIANTESPDFRLEQAEFKEKEKIWEIVVSYLVQNANKSENASNIFGFQQLPYERIYKKVKINENKKIIGFYIYENK
ncbi:MAG TPA: hypothetical protein DER05_14550 [Lutibacter sp.]|nr:hypothetical protein [Lutibacter sp.]